MPFNFPTVTKEDISFGPGRLFLGPAGATPTTDIGAIAEDGITFATSATKRDIRQGNPKMKEFSFFTEFAAMMKVTGIEWNLETLRYGLGGGVTSGSSTFSALAVGGDPFPTELAIHIQHQMAISGNTMNVYGWRAQAGANVEIVLGDNEHSFPFEYELLRSTEDWAGNPLPADEQLYRVERTLA